MRVERPPLVTIRLGAKLATLKRDSRRRESVKEVPVNKPRAAPVMKWAGGKQWLTPLAVSLLPDGFEGTYFEPFLGGAALFFAISPSTAILSDVNPDLIEVYEALKADVDLVIAALRNHKYEEDYYYELRAQKPRAKHTRAARTLYLNRACWNGLYRVNQEGKFNVPFGRYKNPTICDQERLRAAATALRTATLQCCDFDDALRNATRGDLVYFDPPYITGHKDNGFLKYNSRLFSWADQKRLAETAIRPRDRGVSVLISNANHGRVAAQYPGFYRYRLARNSLIGGLGSMRGRVFEMLLSSYPLMGVRSEVI